MNEAVRPLNKQDLDGNRTKENTIYSWARALNRFNAVVKEQKSGPRVIVRTPTEAEVDGQASKEAKVRGQQTFEHKNLCVKRLFSIQKWHQSSATHVHLVLISGDGANSYHKMLHCSVYSFSLWCHCQLIPINTIFFIRFVDFLSEGVFIQSSQRGQGWSFIPAVKAGFSSQNLIGERNYREISVSNTMTNETSFLVSVYLQV